MKGTQRGATLALRAFYSIPELASVACVSRQRLQRVLVANGVAFIRSGRRLYVPLTEIERCLPQLWGSLARIEAVLARVGASR